MASTLIEDFDRIFENNHQKMCDYSRQLRELGIDNAGYSPSLLAICIPLNQVHKIIDALDRLENPEGKS